MKEVNFFFVGDTVRRITGDKYLLGKKYFIYNIGCFRSLGLTDSEKSFRNMIDSVNPNIFNHYAPCRDNFTHCKALLTERV